MAPGSKANPREGVWWWGSILGEARGQSAVRGNGGRGAPQRPVRRRSSPRRPPPAQSRGLGLTA